MGNTDDPVLYRNKKIKLFFTAVLFSMSALMSGLMSALMFVVVIPRLPGSICLAPAFVFQHGSQHEFCLTILRFRKSGFCHVPVDAIDAFAKFLYKFILGQQLNSERFNINFND